MCLVNFFEFEMSHESVVVQFSVSPGRVDGSCFCHLNLSKIARFGGPQRKRVASLYFVVSRLVSCCVGALFRTNCWSTSGRQVNIWLLLLTCASGWIRNRKIYTPHTVGPACDLAVFFFHENTNMHSEAGAEAPTTPARAMFNKHHQ